MATPSKTAANRPVPTRPSRPTTARAPDSLAPSAQRAYDDDMIPPPFDTLRAAARLREEGGFDEVQANAVVTTFADCMSQTLASKADIQRSEQAVRRDADTKEAAIRADMKEMEAAIRADMEKMEAAIRADMEKMEAAIRADMEKMEAAIRADMKEMEAAIRADMREMEVSLRREIEKTNARMDLIAEQLANQIASTARKTLLQLGTLMVTLASILAALQRMGII